MITGDRNGNHDRGSRAARARLGAAAVLAVLTIACGSDSGGNSGNSSGGGGNVSGKAGAAGTGGSAGRGGRGGSAGSGTGGDGGSSTGGTGGTAGTAGSGCYEPAGAPGRCVPWTRCEPGERVSREGTQTTDRECEPCATGTFSDGFNASECREKTDCEPGEYVAREGTRVADRSCAPCEDGVFSDGVNASECELWSECPPGEYIAEEGTRARDRRCSECEEGTFSDGPNASRCEAWTDCAPGQFVRQAGTSVLDRSCEACAAGFSEDENAGSCTAFSDCEPGQYVVDWGTDSHDRVCSACPDETLSALPNSPECSPWQVCEAGRFVAQQGSPTSNRSCGTCSGATFTAEDNLPACSAWTDCGAGEYVTGEPSNTRNRQCAACPDGTYNTSGTNLTACTPWTPCVAGEYVSARGTATANQVCSACPDDTFSATEDASQCEPWTLCVAGEYLSTRGTSSTDHVCTACPAGRRSAGYNAHACSPPEVVAGEMFSCVLAANGSVTCWGSGAFGQLGYGNTSDIGDDETPASAGTVNVGESVLQLVAGNVHACALLAGGTVRCWGRGDEGQLGYGNTNSIGDNEVPASAGNVDVGADVVQIAAGAAHTCALLASGDVRCWGFGEQGRLGYGNTNTIGDDEPPASAGSVNVGGVVVALAAGNGHTCALLASGDVRCWGRGDEGQLGYGNTNHVGDDETPASAGNVDVGGVVVAVTAGSSHTCALLASGDVRCWGRGAEGQLGYGNFDTLGDNESPASAGNVNVGGRVTQIDTSAGHTCAVLAGGTVRCWGFGGEGRLGYGNTRNVGDNEAPASAGDVEVGGTVVQVTTGSYHTCALLSGDDVRCWGYDSFGQLGYGHTNNIGDNETPASAGTVTYR